VSEAGPDLDRSLLQLGRDVVLVCFGTHTIGDCPLDAPPQREHGVVFETDGHPAGDSFISRFSELARADLPIRVNLRMATRIGFSDQAERPISAVMCEWMQDLRWWL
jgi:hypothetical protein